VLLALLFGSASAHLRGDVEALTEETSDWELPSLDTIKGANISAMHFAQDENRAAAKEHDGSEQQILAEIKANMKQPGPGVLTANMKGWKFPVVKGKYYSQAKQDKLVDKLLRNMSDGFIVEAGANDGLQLSNSLFFEVNRHWGCLLVEPDPWQYKALAARNRSCYSIQSGLALDKTGEELDFRASGPLGGFIKGFQNQTEAREWTKKNPKKAINVKTYPLDLLLKSIGIKTVDYFSLDTEGSEDVVLQNVNFGAIEFGVITVEGNNEGQKMLHVNNTMMEHNFLRLEPKEFSRDDYFVNPSYFKKRGIDIEAFVDPVWMEAVQKFDLKKKK